MLDGSNEFAFPAAVIVSVVVLLLFPLVLFGQKRRDLSSINLWFCSGIVGILFGIVGGFTVVRAMKFQIAKAEDLVAGGGQSGQGGLGGMSMQGSSPPAEAPSGMKGAKARTGGQDAGGMGDAAKQRMMKGMMQTMGGNAKGTKGNPNAGKKGGRGGGRGGRGGRGGGRGGRGGGANSKRTLTALVRKLDVLTGDVQIKLSESQKSELSKQLAAIGDRDELDEAAAKDALEKLQGLLTDDQKAKQAAVGLPFSRRGRGGGRGGRGGGGGSDTDNPFASETNSKALKSLLSKTTPAKKAPVKKETKKAPAKKEVKKKEVKKAPAKKAPPVKKAAPAKKAPAKKK